MGVSSKTPPPSPRNVAPVIPHPAPRLMLAPTVPLVIPEAITAYTAGSDQGEPSDYENDRDPPFSHW